MAMPSAGNRPGDFAAGNPHESPRIQFAAEMVRTARVANAFAQGPVLAAEEPHERMDPVDRGRKSGHGMPEEIALRDVRQLVNDDRVALLSGRIRKGNRRG